MESKCHLKYVLAEAGDERNVDKDCADSLADLDDDIGNSAGMLKVYVLSRLAAFCAHVKRDMGFGFMFRYVFVWSKATDSICLCNERGGSSSHNGCTIMDIPYARCMLQLPGASDCIVKASGGSNWQEEV